MCNGYSDGGIELLYASHNYESRDYGPGMIDRYNDDHGMIDRYNDGHGMIDRFNDGQGAVGGSIISDFQCTNKTIHNQWMDRFRAVTTSTLHPIDHHHDHHAMDKASSLLAAIGHLELQYVMTYGVPAFESELGFFAPGITSLYEL